MNDLISRKAILHRLQQRREDFANGWRTFDAMPDNAKSVYAENLECALIIGDAPAVNPLPCKIGDTAWVICNHKGHKKPKKGVVSVMYYTDDMKLCIVVKFIKRGTWGKDVFGTQEEAWEAIRP